MDPVTATSLIIMGMAVWWFIGTCILVYELRYHMDITVAWLIMAMSLGMVGVLALFCTMARLLGDDVIFARYPQKSKKNN